MSKRHDLGLTLIGAGAGAAAAFGALAAAVARRKTQPVDRALHARMARRHEHEPAVDRAIDVLGHSGKWYVHGTVAALFAALLWQRGRRRAAAALVLSSGAGTLTAKAFDRWIFRQPPPPERGQPANKSFPSGHTLEPAALAMTAAYVLVREGMLPSAAAIPLAIGVPVLSGAGRLYLDRHWVSDVAGGWLAGAAVAAACAAAYELAPRETPRIARRAARRAAALAHEGAETLAELPGDARDAAIHARRSAARRSKRTERGLAARLAAGELAARERTTSRRALHDTFAP